MEAFRTKDRKPVGTRPDLRVHLPGSATPFWVSPAQARRGILTFFTSFSISILSVSAEFTTDEVDRAAFTHTAT